MQWSCLRFTARLHLRPKHVATTATTQPVTVERLLLLLVAHDPLRASNHPAEFSYRMALNAHIWMWMAILDGYVGAVASAIVITYPLSHFGISELSRPSKCW